MTDPDLDPEMVAAHTAAVAAKAGHRLIAALRTDVYAHVHAAVTDHLTEPADPDYETVRAFLDGIDVGIRETLWVLNTRGVFEGSPHDWPRRPRP
jgi:hypothetical protein